jgi:hypothetical protein
MNFYKKYFDNYSKLFLKIITRVFTNTRSSREWGMLISRGTYKKCQLRLTLNTVFPLKKSKVRTVPC